MSERERNSIHLTEAIKDALGNRLAGDPEVVEEIREDILRSLAADAVDRWRKRLWR